MVVKMSERTQRVRARLEEKLGRPLEDNMWQALDDEGYVRDVLNDPDSGFAGLLARARELRRKKRRGSRPNESKSGQYRPDTDEISARRAETVARHFGDDAAELPRVKRFRREVLSGLTMVHDGPSGLKQFTRWTGEAATQEEIEQAGRFTLSDDEISALLESSAAALMSASEFALKRIPIVGHQAELVQRPFVDREPKSGMSGGAEVPASGKRRWTPQTRLRIVWNIKQTEVTTQLELDDSRRRRRRRLISYLDHSGTERTIEVWSGSVLERLRRESAWLAARYPWSPTAALHFLLSGNPPVPWPIEVNYRIHNTESFTYARLELVLEPWMPADHVHRVYREAQFKMLGGDNRQITKEQLDVYDFVTPRRAGPQAMSFANITDEWMREFPGRAPRKPNHLYNYWTRAIDKLFPNYHLPVAEDDEG